MSWPAALVSLLAALPLAPADPALPEPNLPLPRAVAPAETPAAALIGEVVVATGVNPAELGFSARLGYRLPIFASANPWLARNEVAVGMTPRLSLRGFGLGPFLELQPASFFRIRFAAELVQFFGLFDTVSSYRDPSEDYWPPTDPYVAGGGRLQVQPSLFAKVGPVTVRNVFSASFWNLAVVGSDRVFYEVETDTLLARKGWVLGNTVDATYPLTDLLTVGVRYAMTAPLYGVLDPAPLADRNGNHRLGAIAGWLPPLPKVGGARAVLVGDLGFWVAHRYRAGMRTTPLLPRLWISVLLFPH